MDKKSYMWDASGQLGQALLTTLAGQLTYFYTEKVSLSAAVVATILAVTKLISSFFDLAMGRLMDLRKGTGEKKYAIWLSRMAVPFAVCTVMLFCVPHGSGAVSNGYVFLTNLLVAVIGSAIAVPYAALQIVETGKTQERSKIGIFRGLASYAGGILITLTVIPVTNMIGGNQKSWVIFAVVDSIIAACFLIVCGSRVTEPGEEAAHEKTSQGRFTQQFKALSRNRYWWTTLIVGIVSQLLYGVNAVSTAYYCKWIFGNDNLMAVIGGFGVLGTAIGFAIINPCVKRLGATKTMRLFLFIGAVSCALRILAPYNLVWNTAMMSIANISLIAMSCLNGVFTGMAFDYNETLSGDKMVSFSQSLISMGNKIGAVVGGSVTGWVLGMTGYSSAMTSLTDTVAQGIFSISIYIPMGSFFLMFILMLTYNLENRQQK